MLTSNQTLLQKADLALADLQAPGGAGLLHPQQAQAFIRIMIKRAVLMPLATVRSMKSPKMDIDKMRFATRILRPSSPSTALPVAERAKPDLTQAQLDVRDFKTEVRLSNEVLEDQIEQGNLKNSVMQEMAKALARDVEEVAVNGNTNSADPFLSQLDGILAQATSNIVGPQAASLDKDTLRDMLKEMPSEFLVDKRSMAYLTSIDAEIDYRDSLVDRETPTGDRALGAFVTSQDQVYYNGIPVIPVPLFPEALGNGENETNVLLLDPKNMHYGFHRDIRVETDKDISAGEVIIVASLRFDVKYAEETAVVKATGITVS